MAKNRWHGWRIKLEATVAANLNEEKEALLADMVVLDALMAKTVGTPAPRERRFCRVCGPSA